MNTQHNTISTGTGIIIAGILIAGAILYTNGGAPGGTKTALPEVAKSTYTVSPTPEGDHLLGSPNAEIIITEYSDTECPFCKTHHETLHQIVDAYEGKVAWKYVHYPLSIHPLAFDQARATECAYELGGNVAFWNYLDYIFKITPSNNKLDMTLLPLIAKEIGLNKNDFNACFDSGKYKERIDADIAIAQEAGARGTPYAVITTKDGKAVPLSGAVPFEKIKTEIDKLLAE